MSIKIPTSTQFRVIVFLAALAFLSADASAQKRKKPRIKPITASVTVSASNPTPAQRRMEAFETAWWTINEQYFDKTFGGLDWKKVKAEFQPRVAAAKTDVQFHRLLKEMISRLGRSHLNVIAPEYFEIIEIAREKAREKGKRMAAERRGEDPESAAAEEETEEDDLFGDAANARYGIGVEVRMLGGRVVITRVDKQSGATIAGLKPGFIIDKINGVSIGEIVKQALIEGNSQKEIDYLLPFHVVGSFLNGDPDTSVFLTCIDENDKSIEITVPRLALSGHAISISKNLPEQFLKYEAYSLSPDVGYIKFNAFAVPVIARFCDSLTEFHDKSSIIVDLRGNLGGILGSMIGLTGMLTDRNMSIGTFVARNGSSPFTAESKAKNFKGKLILLVDSLSMSAAELFTAGLQGHGRAIVVGERTGGQSLPAVWTKLSTGAVMVYPVADFITPKGVSLEGVGLQPDHVVSLDRGSLLKGSDTQLEKALAISKEPSKEKGTSAEEIRLDRLTVIGSSDTRKEFIGTTDAPPPPPPPKAVGSGSGAPPPPKVASVPPPNDQRSLDVIAEFARAIGGVETLKALTSYEARGTVTAGPEGETEGELYAARQFPDKYMMVIDSPTLGQVRETYNGKTGLLQADYGADSKLEAPDPPRMHLYSPIFNALDTDYLKALKFEGEFEVEGRKRRVLSGMTREGMPVGLSFDSETKMLATFSMPGLLYTLGDYRKVEGVTLPFALDLEGLMSVRLSSLTFNTAIDASKFEREQKCFDIAN